MDKLNIQYPVLRDPAGREISNIQVKNTTADSLSFHTVYTAAKFRLSPGKA